MIRVRFAPSPTGFLHIGSLRACFYNWLFAKKNKGKLILRIEDTDRSRLVPESIPDLLLTLKKCGLDWDEGPFLQFSKNKKDFIIKQKGNYGPYIQSQRLHIYQQFAQKLVDLNKAYYCFCSKERLEKIRQQAIKNKKPPKYDGHCRNLSPSYVKAQLKAHRPYVIRLKVPQKGQIKFKDIIRKDISFNLKDLDDQILLKSDGWPTFHLSSVVDDHLMKISHIIRGEEWLSSVPKHLLIYQALGWKPPQMAHLPLLLNANGSKLSKRQGDTAVEDYLAKGYLKEAILNFIALLGWNPKGDKEIFTLEELISHFSLEKLGKSGAIFNKEKLNWLNGYYIRKMNLTDLTKRCIPYLISKGLISPLKSETKIEKAKFRIKENGEIVDFDFLKKIVQLEQERLERLEEIGEKSHFFFEQPSYNPNLLFWKDMKKAELENNLKMIKEAINKIPINQFKKNKLEEIIIPLSNKQGRGEILWPLRVALTGEKGSPPPLDIAAILGKQKTLSRIEKAIQYLKNTKNE